MANNSLGVDWTDPESHDNMIHSGADKIVLPVDATSTRARIASEDVPHNFYLPHFGAKMDAMPGLATHFVCKPTKTTAQMRQELRACPEWNVPVDPADPWLRPDQRHRGELAADRQDF